MALVLNPLDLPTDELAESIKLQLTEQGTLQPPGSPLSEQY